MTKTFLSLLMIGITMFATSAIAQELPSCEALKNAKTKIEAAATFDEIDTTMASLVNAGDKLGEDGFQAFFVGNLDSARTEALDQIDQAITSQCPKQL